MNKKRKKNKKLYAGGGKAYMTTKGMRTAPDPRRKKPVFTATKADDRGLAGGGSTMYGYNKGGIGKFRVGTNAKKPQRFNKGGVGKFYKGM